MMKSGEAFQWSDAWLFLAIGFAASHRRASLGEVITTADGLQHAVITRDELNGGIGRLKRAGYISYTQDGLTVTTLGRTLFLESARAATTHGKRQAEIERALSAVPWSPDWFSAQALNGELEVISLDTYNEAIGRRDT